MMIFTRFFLTNIQAVIQCFLTSFLHFNLLVPMRKSLSFIVVATLATSSVYAATGDMKPPMTPAIVPTGTQTTANLNISNTGMNATVNTGDQNIQFNAATNNTTSATTNTTSATTTQSISLGEAKSVSCTSDAAFTSNTCDQCFEAPSIKVGQRLTGLFDNWINSTSTIFIAYQDEQKTPNMIPFGATTWTSNPADETKIWKDGSDIAWVPSATGNRKQYMLPANQKVRFVESDLAAGYTLSKTDRKNGEVVGMIRYPITYHVLDAAGTEGAAKTHYECMTYKLSAPTVTPTNPTKPTTPAEVTKPQTGPAETLILIVAAFFIAFGLMFSLRKRV